MTSLTLAPVEAHIDIPTIGGGLTLDVDLGELGEDLGKMNMVSWTDEQMCKQCLMMVGMEIKPDTWVSCGLWPTKLGFLYAKNFIGILFL